MNGQKPIIKYLIYKTINNNKKLVLDSARTDDIC